MILMFSSGLDAAKRERDTLKALLEEEKIQKTQGKLLNYSFYSLILEVNIHVS